MGHVLLKCVFGHMRTVKTQNGLHIHAVWAGPSLSTNRITGYYRMYEWRVKAQMTICNCAGRFELAHFVHVQRPFWLHVAHIMLLQFWCNTSKVLLQPTKCCTTTKILEQSCCNITNILLQSCCYNLVSVLPKYCYGPATTLTKYCCNSVVTLPKYNTMWQPIKVECIVAIYRITMYCCY